ncbi:methyltransferase domain-containing protein [Mycobacterium pyrenivorans]|nr:methyltransferase domain-containing protein [Mycolicibacterium pyrenivorans]
MRPSAQPADLDTVRDSYDRVADNYVTMVMTTGTGDIRTHPWHKAAIDAFADTVAPIGPVLDVGCGPGTVTAYLAAQGIEVSGIDLSPRSRPTRGPQRRTADLAAQRPRSAARRLARHRRRRRGRHRNSVDRPVSRPLRAATLRQHAGLNTSPASKDRPLSGPTSTLGG